MGRRTLISVVVVVAAALVAGGVGAVALRDGDDPAPEQPGPPQAGPGTESPAAEPGELGEPEPVVETVAEGFNRPWGMAFLPEPDRLLVTQAVGVLSLVDTGTGEIRDVAGVPEVDTGGQGGLLDVALHPDFPDPAWVYLSYATTDGTGANSTHLARGRLNAGQDRLEDLEVLFVAQPFRASGAHFGSRIVFDEDGYLFMTIGDRGDKNFDDHPSQDPSNTLGTTIRLHPDGAVPEDNPFVADPAVADEIYSYGHRNVQGMAVQPETGEIWQSEHGERDGDQINIVERGGNHGWPVTHTGCQYGTDLPVGDHPADRDDIVDPIHYWECGTGGFPPAGITFYTGDEFPTWQGDLLVAGLASQYVARFQVDGRSVTEAEPLLAEQGWRFRDIAVSPHDGTLYLAIDGEDAPLVRLVDAANR